MRQYTSHLKTTDEHWQEAQRGELAFWDAGNRLTPKRRLRLFLKRLFRRHSDGDDYNYWWREQFDGYAAIPTHLENALEVGCGPFTNMRLILAGRSADHVHCSDPLARHYLCYADRWLSRQHRAGAILLDDHPLEECPYADDYFDLVVMNNVLDHVRDASLCLEQVVRVTKPGGLLIVGQDLCPLEAAKPGFEEGLHPIRLAHGDLDRALLPRFDQVLYRLLPPEKSRTPGPIEETGCYGVYLFIGRKRPS